VTINLALKEWNTIFPNAACVTRKRRWVTIGNKQRNRRVDG
jgi:hypothetical protein